MSISRHFPAIRRLLMLAAPFALIASVAAGGVSLLPEPALAATGSQFNCWVAAGAPSTPNCDFYAGVGANYGPSSGPDLGTEQAVNEIDYYAYIGQNPATAQDLYLGSSFGALSGGSYSVPPSCPSVEVPPGNYLINGNVDICGYWVMGQAGGGPNGGLIGMFQVSDVLDWYGNTGNSYITPSNNSSLARQCQQGYTSCTGALLGFYGPNGNPYGTAGQVCEWSDINNQGWTQTWCADNGTVQTNAPGDCTGGCYYSAMPNWGSFESFGKSYWQQYYRTDPDCSGCGSVSMVWQSDGNLVVLNSSGSPIWATDSTSFEIPVTATCQSEGGGWCGYNGYPSGASHPGFYETPVWYTAWGSSAGTCYNSLTSGGYLSPYWYRSSTPPGCSTTQCPSVDNGGGGLDYCNVNIGVPQANQQFFAESELYNYTFTGDEYYYGAGASWSFPFANSPFEDFTVEPRAPAVSLSAYDPTPVTGEQDTFYGSYSYNGPAWAFYICVQNDNKWGAIPIPQWQDGQQDAISLSDTLSSPGPMTLSLFLSTAGGMQVNACPTSATQAAEQDGLVDSTTSGAVYDPAAFATLTVDFRQASTAISASPSNPVLNQPVTFTPSHVAPGVGGGYVQQTCLSDGVSALNDQVNGSGVTSAEVLTSTLSSPGTLSGATFYTSSPLNGLSAGCPTSAAAAQAAYGGFDFSSTSVSFPAPSVTLSASPGGMVDSGTQVTVTATAANLPQGDAIYLAYQQGDIPPSSYANCHSSNPCKVVSGATGSSSLSQAITENPPAGQQVTFSFEAWLLPANDAQATPDATATPISVTWKNPTPSYTLWPT